MTLVAASAGAGLLWLFAFTRWTQSGGYLLFKIADRCCGLRGPFTEMSTDVPFALASGMALAWLFLRFVRNREYAAEAVAIPVFLASVATMVRAGGEGTRYFVAMPSLMLAMGAFAITVGYVIEFRRCCAALVCSAISCSAES